jgi:hypothetical protein
LFFAPGEAGEAAKNGGEGEASKGLVACGLFVLWALRRLLTVNYIVKIRGSVTSTVETLLPGPVTPTPHKSLEK